MSKRRYHLKPTAYIILGVLLLIIILCVYAIARAISGGKTPEIVLSEATPTPEIVQSTMTPVPQVTPTPTIIIVQEPTATPAVVVSSPTPAPKATATPRVPTSSERKNAKTGTLKSDGVNLRSGPSTNFERIGSYNKGATMAVYASDGDFYFVKMDKDGKVGFMSKKYVTMTNATAAVTSGKATPTPNVPSNAVSGKVTAKTVAIRNAADKTAKAVGEVKSGDVVYVFYKTGDFYYIETPSGKKGYCWASYIKASNVPSKN